MMRAGRVFAQVLLVPTALLCGSVLAAGAAAGAAALTASLTVSPTAALSGSSVTVTADGLGWCVEPDTGDTAVRLLWDDVRLTDHVERRGYGHASIEVTVPPAEPGEHVVSAECYDPISGRTTSDPLVRTGFEVLAPTPSIQVSPTSASPGERITISGTEFTQCVQSESSDTAVRLLWDGQPLVDHTEKNGVGRFIVDVTVPDASAVGNHIIAAECLDPTTGQATSPALAEATLGVPVNTTTTAAPTTTAASTTTATSTTTAPSTTTTDATTTTEASSPAESSSPSGAGIASPGAPSNNPTSSISKPVGRSVRLVGISGAAILLLLLFALYVATHLRAGRRGAKWVHNHVRVVGSGAGRTVEIKPRPGKASTRVRLAPHPDPGRHGLKDLVR